MSAEPWDTDDLTADAQAVTLEANTDAGRAFLEQHFGGQHVVRLPSLRRLDEVVEAAENEGLTVELQP